MSQSNPNIFIAPVRLIDEDALGVMQSWNTELAKEGFQVTSFDLKASNIPEEAGAADAILVPCAIFNREDAGGYPLSLQTLRVIKYAVDHKKAVFSEAPLDKHLASSRSDDRPTNFPDTYQLPAGYVLPELPGDLKAVTIGQDIDIMREELAEIIGGAEALNG